MPGEGARFAFQEQKDLISDGSPQRLEIAREFEDKIDIQKELAKAEASLDEIKENGETETINVVKMDLGESKPDIQPIGVEVKAPDISPEIRNVEPVAEQKIETAVAPEIQPVATDTEIPIKILTGERDMSSTPEIPVKTDTSETQVEQKIEIIPTGEPNRTVEPVTNEIPIQTAKESPVAESEATPAVPIVEAPINNADAPEAGVDDATQEKPVIESESEKINEIYEEVGKKIFDCWSQYKTIPERNQQVDMVLKLAGEISFINEDTENKVSEGKNFDIYSPIVETLKKIKNRSELVLANKSLEKPIELKSIEEGSDERESILLGNLKELAEEDTVKADNFLYDLGEILLYRKNEDERSEQTAPVAQLKKEMGRDELGKALIELTKEEIQEHGRVPDLEILEPVFKNKFGEHLKSLGLFDLGIMIRRNEVIMDAAQGKGVDSIVHLTEALNSHLQAKREEKEKKTQTFLAQRLTKMAA